MISIVLEPAENGIIKKTIDDNYGGGESLHTTVSVFEESTDSKFKHIEKLFFEICEDLNLNVGNKFDNAVLKISSEWGSNYEPTHKEIDDRIKELKAEIELLELCKS